MITAVIDTNVFVSALIARGTPLAAIESTRLGKSRLLVTVDATINSIRAMADIVLPADVPEGSIRDPKDRIILACAIGGQADFMVSGDKDLTDLNVYEGIPILTPAQFLALLNPPANTSPDDTPRD